MAKHKINGVSSDIADALVEKLEDLVFQHKITNDVANELYRKAAFQLGIWDLHPRKVHLPVPDSETVKERIKRDRAEWGRRIPFPDSTALPRDPLAEALLGFDKT